MPRLPNISSERAIRAFAQAGFKRVSQKGSHVRLENEHATTLIIPLHPGDLKRPLIKALIKQAGLTEDRFRKLL